MPIQAVTLDLPPRHPIDVQFKRIIAASDQHELNLAALASKVAALPAPLTLAQIRQALSATGSNPLNVTNLIGSANTAIPRNASGVLSGTHGQRLDLVVTSLAINTVFLETDRNAIYVVTGTKGAGQWTLIFAWMDDTNLAARPADLGADDIGFLFHDKDTFGLIYRWSGNVWHQHIGLIRDLFANRPVAFTATDTGLLFAATDRGYQTWVLDFGTGAWVLMEGVGGPMRGTLAGIPGGLTANDAGFLYYATDFDRLYRWGGATWADAPGQPSREFVVFRNNASAPVGWAVCDGSATTISTATGGTAAYTTPNLISGGPFGSNFVRSAVNPGATGGVTTHHHSISPNVITSGNDSGPGTVVQAGVGTTVATHTHTHDTTIPALTQDTTILPPYYELVPMVRL